MNTIRRNTFETNSSACHVLTLIKKEELQKMFENQGDLVIHFPDTGEYQTDDKYEIMTIEEAWELWEKHVDEYNEQYKNMYDPNYQFSLKDSHFLREVLGRNFLI